MEQLRCTVFKTNILISSDHLQTLFITVITLEKLGLSHLREHKMKHSFQYTINPLCSCGNDVEFTEHILLHTPQLVNERHSVLSILSNFN